MKVTVGTKFRYSHADANPLWEVKSARGRGTWNCEIVECPDYQGTKKVFGTEEIQASLGMAQVWQKSTDDSENFYRKQKPGTILHYNNGFKAYIRCRVTDDGQLMPFALVGNWAQHDLPKRMPNGFIHLGFHVKKIKEQKAMRPHASLVWEYQHRNDEPNPATLQPISLEVPEMTPEETVAADKHIRLNHLRAIVNDNNLKPDDIFQRVKNFFDPEAI